MDLFRTGLRLTVVCSRWTSAIPCGASGPRRAERWKAVPEKPLDVVLIGLNVVSVHEHACPRSTMISLASFVDPDSKGARADGERIDDPIYVYLMQMGKIPLLSHREEIEAARRIDRSRRRFRRSVLSTDYILQQRLDSSRKCAKGRCVWTARSRCG